MGLGIRRDSLGKFICTVCDSPHDHIEDAMSCYKGHQNVPGPGQDGVREDDHQITMLDIIRNKIDDYAIDFNQPGGTLEAQKRLALSMIEDYEIMKRSDLEEKKKIGGMTMTLAKNASETLTNINKITIGTKSSSVSLNLDGKKSDLDALKEIMLGKSVEVVVDNSSNEGNNDDASGNTETS